MLSVSRQQILLFRQRRVCCPIDHVMTENLCNYTPGFPRTRGNPDNKKSDKIWAWDAQQSLKSLKRYGVTAGKGECSEWEWGREREKACGVRTRRQTGRRRAQREGADMGWTATQGLPNTHLARCFISSPRTSRFFSGSLWTRQWTAWMRSSGLPPSVQTHNKHSH